MSARYVETQYQVVGHNDEPGGQRSSSISFHDTPREAIDHALGYDCGIVKRPDGSLLGEFYCRGARGAQRHAPPAGDASVAARQDRQTRQALALLDLVAEAIGEDGADGRMALLAAEAIDVLKRRDW